MKHKRRVTTVPPVTEGLIVTRSLIHSVSGLDNGRKHHYARAFFSHLLSQFFYRTVFHTLAQAVKNAGWYTFSCHTIFTKIAKLSRNSNIVPFPFITRDLERANFSQFDAPLAMRNFMLVLTSNLAAMATSAI